MVLTWRLRHMLIVAKARVSIAMLPLNTIAAWHTMSPQPAASRDRAGSGSHAALSRIMNSTPEQFAAAEAHPFAATADDGAVLAVVVEPGDAEASVAGKSGVWQQDIPYGQPIKHTAPGVPRFT